MLNLIKNIILPEKIGNYFIFPKRVIGFVVNKINVNATSLYISGSQKISVEKYLEENIETNNNSSEERINRAVANIINKIDKFDSINVSLPGYLVIFKELTLPFLDQTKIRMVLDYEIEATLPFSINEAIVDFIVTKKNTKSKETTILACIVKKQDILDLIKPFNDLNLTINQVNVDVINIYNLYKFIYPQLNSNQILIDVQTTYTNIMCIENGQLRLARTIHYGILNIIKNLADHMQIDQNKAFEELTRFGFDSNNKEIYNNSIKKVLNEFVSSIQFTINSFKSLFPDFSVIEKIIITGNEIKKLEIFLEEQLNIRCEILTINKIVQNTNITFNDKSFPNKGISSLACAYLTKEKEEFNLLRKDLETVNVKNLNKQIITCFILFILSFGLLYGYTYWQKNKLENSVNNQKQEVINKLKNEFNITDRSILKSATEVVKEANNKLNEEENIWFSFSQKTRLSYLKYLNELSKILDKQAIGLNLKKLSISQNIITIQGQVKDFKSLGILENQLNESKLFSHVSVPQETEFNIEITIKKNEDLE